MTNWLNSGKKGTKYNHFMDGAAEKLAAAQVAYWPLDVCHGALKSHPPIVLDW